MEDGPMALPLMGVGDAAQYLGVGRKIVYQLIEAGEIEAVKVNGSVQIKKKSLDEYRASGRLS